MSVLDFVSVGVFNGLHKSSGALDVTIGTAVDSTFGTEVTHTYGTSIELTCCPMSFINTGAGDNLLMALLGGAGGNSTFTFGAFCNAVYHGPAWDIRRAPYKEKHSDYFITSPFGTPMTPPADPVDPLTFAAVRPLAILSVLVPAAFEISLHFAYKDLNPEEFNAGLENLKFLNNFLSSRLLGFTKALECATTDVQVGARLAKEAAQVAAKAGEMLTKIHTAIKSLKSEVKRSADQIEDVEIEMTEMASIAGS